MTIHVRVWTGAGSARVVEMTNAGKRGKMCRMVRFSGWSPCGGDETAQRSSRLCADVLHFLTVTVNAESNYDLVADGIRQFVRAAALPEGMASVHDEEIRGIDAPREPLRAGIEGLWSASADEEGVHLRDLKDVNEWTEITSSKQTNAKAYELAVKVWDRVKEAKTRYEASTILHDAGCKLHGFCGLD